MKAEGGKWRGGEVLVDGWEIIGLCGCDGLLGLGFEYELQAYSYFPTYAIFGILW